MAGRRWLACGAVRRQPSQMTPARKNNGAHDGGVHRPPARSVENRARQQRRTGDRAKYQEVVQALDLRLLLRMIALCEKCGSTHKEEIPAQPQQYQGRPEMADVNPAEVDGNRGQEANTTQAKDGADADTMNQMARDKGRRIHRHHVNLDDMRCHLEVVPKTHHRDRCRRHHKVHGIVSHHGAEYGDHGFRLTQDGRQRTAARKPACAGGERQVEIPDQRQRDQAQYGDTDVGASERRRGKPGPRPVSQLRSDEGSEQPPCQHHRDRAASVGVVGYFGSREAVVLNGGQKSAHQNGG